MNKPRKIALFFILYILIASICYVFRVGGEQYFTIVEKFFAFTTPLISIYFGFLAVRYFGIKSLQGKCSSLIMLGIFSWFVADILWYFVFDENDLVSVADLFYLLGYVLLTAGIVAGIKLSDSEFFKSKKSIVFFAVLAVIFSMVYFNILPVQFDSSLTVLENAFTVGYSLADLILLVGCIAVLMSIFMGSYSKSWIAFAAGCVITLAGDIIYSVSFSTYNSGDIVDLTWLVGYILFAASFYIVKNNAETVLVATQKKKETKATSL